MRLTITKERPVKVVPATVIIFLILALSLQIIWHKIQPEPVAQASMLPSPPDYRFLNVVSLGERITLSGVLMLWLQAFDHQPGLSISFRELDYSKVIAWLKIILKLNPDFNYPLLSAARVYSLVQDETRQRQMLEFVYHSFLEKPNQRWPHMAHAVYMAKHKLQDLKLALKYAKALRANVSHDQAPSWVLQMELFVLEEMGEVESAKVLLGGLLEEGVIKDKNEFLFLQERLGEIRDK